MTWQSRRLIQHFVGEFKEPPEHELEAYGWTPKRVPKKAVVDTRKRRVPCPVCGGTKSIKAKQCRDCNTKDRQKQPINHGTNGGYQAHNKRGEEACGPCSDAHRASGRFYRDTYNHTNTKEIAA